MRMKNHLFTVTALSAALLAGPALAQYGAPTSDDYFPTWYIGLHGSVNALKGSDLGTYPLPETDWNPGFAVGASAGVKMPRAFIQPLGGLSFEGEITRYWQQIDNNRTDLFFPLMAASEGERDYDVTAYMLNAYWHIPTNTLFTPYIGGGIGYANVELASDPVAPAPGTEEDDVAAWQAMVGLTFEEDPTALTQWHVGYKYFTTDDVEFDDGWGGTTVLETDIHSLEAGVKYRF